jgi:hypothetical protein
MDPKTTETVERPESETTERRVKEMARRLTARLEAPVASLSNPPGR